MKSLMIMKGQELAKRTKTFAFDTVRFTETLPNEYIANHIRSQLVRCATSVAAKYRASMLAQSGAAFVAKLSIVVEESDECEFWLDFLASLNFGNMEIRKRLLKEAHELTSIFVVSRRTAQKNLSKK
ncbi:MAG: four helix bundle protein [Bacilli bacterium]|nr:four helix bundle protein [Bacilli bacterium]